ncbi:MAG: orotidine-5'-phosphate decarboxylase [Gemmatimonadetes bacterium]|nr:orotidine-5'-phosphate decarboxylase [Gemmatimonadota bacterium]
MAELILPLDQPSQREALALVDAMGEGVSFYKVGLELFTREGPGVVRALHGRRKRVFLDLKLHDIPNTVAGAVRAAAELDVELLTVHAGGGRAMLEAAAEAARDTADGALRLLAVTVLTSLSEEGLGESWGRGIDDVGAEVLRLAELAKASGIDGVVSSAHEVAGLRRTLGPDAVLVTPGIRLPGGDAHDQARVATPDTAVADGADYLVVGRAITGARDPHAALAAVLESMGAAV